MSKGTAIMIKICGTTVCLGDKLTVVYTADGPFHGSTIEGEVIELWSPELNNHLQCRLSCGWCFHDHDEIIEHIKIEDQLIMIPVEEEANHD